MMTFGGEKAKRPEDGVLRAAPAMSVAAADFPGTDLGVVMRVHVIGDSDRSDDAPLAVPADDLR